MLVANVQSYCRRHLSQYPQPRLIVSTINWWHGTIKSYNCTIPRYIQVSLKRNGTKRHREQRDCLSCGVCFYCASGSRGKYVVKSVEHLISLVSEHYACTLSAVDELAPVIPSSWGAESLCAVGNDGVTLRCSVFSLQLPNGRIQRNGTQVSYCTGLR